MATLTAIELNSVQREYERNRLPIRFRKAVFNAAAQAVEDRMTNSAAIIAADIDAATAPFGVTLTGAEKKQIAAQVFRLKFARDK